MLVCLYGEMRDALWPERGLSGSMALARLLWLSVACGLRARAQRAAGEVLRSIAAVTSENIGIGFVHPVVARLAARRGNPRQTASPRASAAALRIAEMLVL